MVEIEYDVKQVQQDVKTPIRVKMCCSMCGKKKAARINQDGFFDVEMAKDLFGVHYSDYQGYMSPYDGYTIGFSLCWECVDKTITLEHDEEYLFLHSAEYDKLWEDHKASPDYEDAGYVEQEDTENANYNYIEDQLLEDW